MLINTLLLTSLLAYPALGKQYGAKYEIEKTTEVVGQITNAQNSSGSISIDDVEVYQTLNLTIFNGSGNNGQNVSAVLDFDSPVSRFLGTFKNVTACQAYVNNMKLSSNFSSDAAAKILSNCDMGVVSIDNVDDALASTEYVPPSFSFADKKNLTYYAGSWVNDQILVNGVYGRSQFALASVSNSTNALGLGLRDSVLESFPNSSNLGANKSYFIDSFPNNDSTFRATAFSLFLNNMNATSGELVFGALDQKKYTGALYTLPIIDANETFYTENHPYSLAVGSCSYYGLNNTLANVMSEALPARLDATDAYIRVNTDIADAVAEQFNATWDDEVEHYILDCPSQKEGRASLGFDFGGFNIFVPLHNMVIAAGSQCALAIKPQEAMQFVLGQPFMSSAYFVFDIMNKEISIAQANYLGASKSKTKAIWSTIPGAIAPASTFVLDTLPTAVETTAINTSAVVTNPWTATKYTFQTINATTATSSITLTKREAVFSVSSSSNTTSIGFSSYSDNAAAALAGVSNANLFAGLMSFLYFFL